MTVIGNAILFLATIIFIALATALSKTPPGGDAAVSYIWNILLLNLAFLVCIVVVNIIIGIKGGYDWVSSQKINRFLMVAGGLLFSLVTMGVTGLFKHENGPVPSLLRFLSAFAPVLIPLVLIITGFILLNNNLRISVPSFIYIWPLVTVSCLGTIGLMTGLYAWISESNRNQQAKISGIIEAQNSNHARMLAEIDSCDVLKNMIFILVFTDANQAADVREKAVTKVKTNPQWQQELIKRLNSDWAPEAFNYLASNEVEDVSLFPEAIKEGVLRQAKLFRESIRASSHPSHFYPEQFSWEAERVLRTVDKFKNKGVDFLPALKELRASLDEPSEFKKPRFNCIMRLDGWIKNNG